MLNRNFFRDLQNERRDERIRKAKQRAFVSYLTAQSDMRDASDRPAHAAVVTLSFRETVVILLRTMPFAFLSTGLVVVLVYGPWSGRILLALILATAYRTRSRVCIGMVSAYPDEERGVR